MEKQTDKILKVVRSAIFEGVASSLKVGAGKAQVDLLITKILIDERDLIEYVIKQEITDALHSRHFKKALRKHLEEDLPKTIADSIAEQVTDPENTITSLSTDDKKEIESAVESITNVKGKDQRYS